MLHVGNPSFGVPHAPARKEVAKTTRMRGRVASATSRACLARRSGFNEHFQLFGRHSGRTSTRRQILFASTDAYCYTSVITLPAENSFRIEASSGVPITRQIAEQIRTRVASGALRAGERLPSVRELSRDLAINQNTVLRVYERLTAEGLLERRHGDGTYVADRLPVGRMKSERSLLRDELRRLVRRALLLGVEPVDLHSQLDKAIADESSHLEKPS